MTIGSSCILLVPDDTVKTGRRRPQMLEDLVRCPLLGWMVSGLMAAGAVRFFVVCHPQYADLVRSAMPPDADVVISTNQDASDRLHVFLSTADEQEQTVTVVTGAAIVADAVPARAGRTQQSCVMQVDRRTLMDALDESFHFYEFLQRCGRPLTEDDGVFSVERICDWQDAFRRQVLRERMRCGVSIWDEGSTFVAPTVRIGVGTELLPGTILCGSTAIGADASVGPHALLSDTSVGDETRIGPGRLTRCRIGSRAEVGAYCALEDVTVGDDGAVSDGACLRGCAISAPAASSADDNGGSPRAFFRRIGL